jgi:hypothetical protein
MIHMKQMIAGACTALLGITWSIQAIAGVTPNDIFNAISADDRKRLEAGEIVTVARPKQESNDSGLAIGLGVILPASLQKTLDALRQINASSDPAINRMTREIQGPVTGDGRSRAFADIRFSKGEADEVAKLLKSGPGDDFNLSQQEWSWVKAASGKGDPVTTTSAAMRRVLENRYLAYMKQGLNGLSPYARSGNDQTQPGVELAASVEALSPAFRQRLPEFFQSYRHFPKGDGKDLKNRFFWEKKTVEKRPMFSLRHELVQVRPDGATIGNREYYISNQLNGLQVVIMLIPHGSQTMAVMLNETYTDKVSGAGRFVAARVGRSIVESNTRPMFEKLQKTLGSARPPAAASAQ